MTAGTAMPQHMRAMARANEVRLGRAAMRDKVELLPRPAGFHRVAELLEDPPELIDTLKVLDLLTWVHRVGNSYARSILMHADPVGGPISEARRVGELSERQRYVLADYIYEQYARGRS